LTGCSPDARGTLARAGNTDRPSTDTAIAGGKGSGRRPVPGQTGYLACALIKEIAMQQLGSTNIDTFSSARFMSSSDQAAPRAASLPTADRHASQVSVFSGTFSNTTGGSTAFGAGFGQSRSLTAVNIVSVSSGQNARSMSAHRHSSCASDKTDHVRGKHGNADNACGTGVLSSIGSAIIGCVSKGNELLNTPLISSVGQIFNQFGICGRACHLAPDLAGYAVSKLAIGIGKALGGTGSPDYHFEHEWLRSGSSSARA
jgi:hypothetical protein